MAKKIQPASRPLVNLTTTGSAENSIRNTAVVNPKPASKKIQQSTSKKK